MEDTTPTPKKVWYGKTIPVTTRLLRALEEIYNSSDATIAEKLQALQLSVEVVPMRTKPRRKTDKEKAVIEALKSGTKKKGPEGP